MDPNLVSATLSAEDLAAINGAIETINQKLPFLIDLTNEERRAIPKLGVRTESFVRGAVETAAQHETLFAPGFLEEMHKDAHLMDALSPILLAVQTLAKKLDDTSMQVGAEAFAAARTVYSLAKTPFAKAPMRDAAGELSRRYGRSKKAKAEAAAAAASAPGSTSTTPHTA